MIDSARLLAAAPRDVAEALKSAAGATGADFGYLVRTAARESGFDASARAGTSSAAGLFQFTTATWLNLVDRHGARHGVDVAGLDRAGKLALRDDPGLSARMAAELARENSGLIEARIGRAPTHGELYAAHFLGAAGAARLIEAAGASPDAMAGELFPAAAAANPAVFNDRSGAPETVAALYRKLTAEPAAGAAAPRAATGSLRDEPLQAAPPGAPPAGGGLPPVSDPPDLGSRLVTLLLELQSVEDRASEEARALRRI